MDRWNDDCWCDHDDDFDDDERRRERRGLVICKGCGDEVPESHCETDSGECIGCEDRRYDERRAAEEAQEETYALCLTGLQPKPKKRKRKK